MVTEEQKILCASMAKERNSKTVQHASLMQFHEVPTGRTCIYAYFKIFRWKCSAFLRLMNLFLASFQCSLQK